MAASIIPLAGNATAQGASGNLVGAGVGAAQTGLGISAAYLGPVAAIPIIGGVVAAIGAIAGSLLAASAKRASEAKDENSAVTSAIQHMDQAITQIFQAANSGQIDANGAITLLAQVKQQYWQICAPHIQPGRNGCQNGNAIPPATVGKCADAYHGCPGNSTFDKSWGISCCIGSTVHASLANCAAVFQAGGGTAKICNLNPSKYGFPGRAAYTITYTPSAGGALGSAVESVAAPVVDALQKTVTSLGLPAQIAGVGTGTIVALVAAFVILRKVF